MELELGKCYQVLKTDGTTIKFKFIGNIPNDYEGIFVEIDGEQKTLFEVLQGGCLAYFEIPCV